MYSYYEYQAKSMISDMTLYLKEGYAEKALIGTIWASVFAFIFVLIAAIAIKKARPLGIIVALMQPVGLYSAMRTVLAYATIDFSSLEMTVTSKVSMDDAMSKLYEKLGEKMLSDVFPGVLAMTPWLLLSLTTFIMSLVYFINISKKPTPGSGLAKAALIITIIKYVLVSPIETFSLLLEKGSSTIQSAWDVVFHLLYLIPLLFIMIQGIVNFSANAKAKKQPEVAAVESDAAETIIVSDSAEETVENNEQA